jgi:hypothetical protein
MIELTHCTTHADTLPLVQTAVAAQRPGQRTTRSARTPRANGDSLGINATVDQRLATRALKRKGNIT